MKPEDIRLVDQVEPCPECGEEYTVPAGMACSYWEGDYSFAVFKTSAAYHKPEFNTNNLLHACLKKPL